MQFSVGFWPGSLQFQFQFCLKGIQKKKKKKNHRNEQTITYCKYKNMIMQKSASQSQLHKIIWIKFCHNDFKPRLYCRAKPPESVCWPVEGECCLGIAEVSNGCCWNIKHDFAAMQRVAVFLHSTTIMPPSYIATEIKGWLMCPVPKNMHLTLVS